MDIKKLNKDQLLLLAAELGLEVSQSMRKPEIRHTIEEVDFEDEIADAWAIICRVEKERVDEREKRKEKEKKQAELEAERENKKIELEIETARLERVRLERSESAVTPQ